MLATGYIYHFHSRLPACLQCRKSELCLVLLTLMEFWQDKQLHCSEIMGKHSFSTSFSASSPGSHTLIPLLKRLYSSFSLHSVPTVLTWQLLNCIIFPHSQTNRDLSPFLSGSWGNQMSFLLRSAAVKRKKGTQKNLSYHPRPWLGELAKIKTIHTKVQTSKDSMS